MPELILNVSGAADALAARSRALRRAGYRVTEASSEQEALELCAVVKPSLITIGELPGIIPRRDPAMQRVPVIAMISAQGEKHGGRGADLCLPEDASSALLISVVQLFLRTASAERQLARARAVEKRLVKSGRSPRDAKRGEAARTRLRPAPREITLVDLATLVHDLRSTLCTVTVVSSWILGEYGEQMDDNGREYLTLLQKSVERMRGVVDTACQWSKGAERSRRASG